MQNSHAHTNGVKKKYPPLEQLIADIDQRIKRRPHPYATDGFEAFLGSQLGSFKRRGKQYFCFQLRNMHFALPMHNTQEITYRTEITPLPNLPQWVLGVSNVRGEIISVVNLALVLGVAGPGAPSGNHLILMHNAGMTVGVLVDKISGTIFDEDPNHQIQRRASEDEHLSRFIDTIFLDGSRRIHLLTVPRLMSALAIN